MTNMPTGLAMWGQAGRYTAQDDRIALTALTGGRAGICRAASFSPAESGTLDVTVDGGWLAVADAGDGTVMAAGALQPGVITMIPGDDPAGGAGPRRDLVYCYVMPDDGSWHVTAVPAADAEGRPGIALATVDVPAGATSADQMVITPRPADFLIEGLQGPAGEPGATGPQGNAVNIRGTLDSPSELPATGNAGDAWLIGGNLWVWTGGGAPAAAGAAPLANWPLADPAGSPEVLESVAGNDGIVSATAVTLGAADPWGGTRAAQFTTFTGAIWVPPAVLNRMLSGPHTLLAWVRSTANPFLTILGGNDRDDNMFVFFGIGAAGALAYRRSPGQLITATWSTRVTDGTWHRVGFRVDADGVTLTFWVDGVMAGQYTLSATPPRTCTAAAIGHSGVVGQPNGMVGNLARIRVWARALSDDEMTAAAAVNVGIPAAGAAGQEGTP